MNFKKVLILIAGLLVLSAPVWAQDSTATRQRSAPEPARLDITLMGGYAWTVSQSATYSGVGGDVDLKSGEFWGIALDINANQFAQLRLLYRRQDTQVTWKQAGTTEDLGDMAVEYWHIGLVKGMTKGKVKPFTTISLGGTHFIADGADNWKFSAILGLGAKMYVSPKIGFMLAGNMPISFTNAFVGVGMGGLSIGGSGIVQFDLAAGIILSL